MQFAQFNAARLGHEASGERSIRRPAKPLASFRSPRYSRAPERALWSLRSRRKSMLGSVIVKAFILAKENYRMSARILRDHSAPRH
jgi:hypothetical protein